MRKFKLFLTLLMLMCIGVTQMRAADQVYTGTVAKVDANGDQTMNGVAWTITSDNTSGLGQAVNTTKGAQIGSGSKPTRSLTFETTGIEGTIKEVVVNTSGASGFTGTVSVTVGSTAFLYGTAETASLTTSATDYTFKGEATGKITIAWAQPSTSKAIYVKTIQVTYGEASSCTNTVTVTKVTPSNGDFEISAESVCGDGEGGEVTISNIEPATGYTLDEVYATVGTYSAVTGKVTGITANTSITVTFKALPKYTVSFNVGGSSATINPIEEASAGAGITLPAGPTPKCVADGWAFAGWAKASVDAEATSASLLPAGTYYPESNNEILYAVYSRTETGSGVAFARYEKVTSNPEDWSGKYLLAAETDNTPTYYTFSGKTGATAGGSTEHTPGTTEKTAWEVTVAKTTNGYSLYHGGEYLGLTSDGNNLNFNSTFAVTNYEWTLSYDNGAQSVSYPARYIECNTNSSYKVACYKATQKRFYLYKRIEESSSTTYYLSAPDCCEKHAITIANDIENGSVEADLEEACQNTVVTLTPTADGSYHFESWSVKDANDNTITVTDNKFSMPATAVTVSATFAHDACSNLAKPELDGEIAKTYNSATIAWVELDGAVEYAVSVVRHSDSESIFSGNVDALSKALENLVPETQYDYTIMAVGNGTDYCAEGNGVLEGHFTTEKLPEVQLTLIVAGEQDERSAKHAILTKFNLPNTASVSGCPKEFVGWDRSSTCAVAPEFEPGEEMEFAANAEALTLYAVFADVKTPGVTSYVKTTLADIASGSIVIITHDNGNLYAMSNDKGTSDAPTAVPVTDTEGVLTEGVADNLLWTITKDGDNLSFAKGDDKLYCSSSNNSVRVGSGAANVFTIKDDYLHNTGNSAYVGVYNSADWRRYSTINSNIENQTLAFYKKVTTAVEYENYSTACVVCKTVSLSAAEVEHGSIKLQVNGVDVESVTTCEAASVDVVATPAAGYELSEVQLTGTASAKAAYANDVISIEAEAEGTLIATATFAQANYSVTMAQTGGANSELSADQSNKHYGDVITVTATAVEGYIFAGWTASPEVTFAEASALSTTFAMPDDNVTVTANFNKVLTVAEARAAIDDAEGETINNQYVKGIIAEVTEYSSQYHSLTYWISDNGTDKSLKVYSGKSFDGANFSSKDDLLVGDEVVVKGNLLYYNNSEYEVNYNNILIVRKQRVLSIALSGEYPTEFNENAGFAHTNMVVTATYNYGDAADVTASASWSEPDMTTAGEKTVTVSYTFDGKTVTKDYTINVVHVCASEVAITKGAETNGTYTVEEGNVCGDEPGATVNVTDIVPAEGYRFKEITTSASGTVDNENKQVTGIKAATTITVVFEEIPSYEVTWNVNGDQTLKTSVQEGSKPAFPATPPSCDESSTTFYGWATAAWTGKAENLNEKTVYTSAADMPEVNAAVTYYAVFAKATAGDPVPTTLWSEDFSSYENGDVPEGGSPISYSVTNGGGTTKIYTSQLGAGGESPELLVAKSNGTFTASGIATNGVSTATLTYHTNQTSNLTVTTSAEHITIGDVSVDGTDTKLCTRTITFAEGAPEAFDLTFTMTAGSNSRLDDIVLSAEIPSVSYVDYLTTCCQKYTITIDSKIENGSVEADLAQACENDEVTLTPTAVGPYHFDAWNVSYNDGENDQTVTVTNNKFNMPAFNVTVSATFVHDDCKALAAPTLDGEVVVDYQSALFAWNAVVKTTEDEDVAANGVVGYVINVSEHEGDPVVEDANITDLTDLSYLVENLDPETQYDFTIMAVGDGTDYCAVNTAYTGNFTTEALPAATLMLSEVGGDDYAIDADEHHVGDNVNLPTELKYTGCTGKVLVGWSSVEITTPGNMPTENYWAAGAEFPLTATSQTLYAVYATAGEGAASTLFSETFNDCDGTGGNDGSWSGSIASSTLTADNTGWTFANGSGAKQCAKFGTAGKKGSAETPAISITGSATLTFKAGAWSGSSEGTTLNVTATGATLDKGSVTMTKGAWDTYTVAITNATNPVKIKFEAKSTGNNRFFLDEVVVSQSTISYSAYTTSCAEALAVPTFNIAGGEFATAQTITLSAVEDATIYYTTDGSNPTTDDVYSAPIVLDACGTTTIKAFAKKDAQESEIVSETYIINLPITNTAENAYTPAEAIAIVDGACDKSEAVFVKGVVTSASLNSTLTNNNAQYNGSYNVYVKEAETDGSVTFEFFRMWKDGEGTAFEEGDIAEGDTLIATGTLTKFTNNNTQVTTYEFNAGCYMVDRKAFVAEKEHIANTQETAYTVAQAIGYCNDAITYDLNDEVYVKGVAIAAPNNAGTFNIHDANVENTFRIYKSELSEELTAAGVEIAANDTVIAKGKILLYNNTTPEMDEGCVVVEVKKYVAHTIAVNPTAVAFGEVEQNATTVDAIEFNAYLTNVASATVTLGGTNANAFSISKNALTENDVISVSVASTALELGEYAATITLHDAAEVAEDVVVNVTMTIIAQDGRKKAQDLDGFEAISGNLNTDIQYASYKGGGTADPNVKDAAIQLYQRGGTQATGGYITFTALKGCKIDQVKITTAKNATDIAYAADGGDLSATTENVAAGTAYLTNDDLDAQEVSIYCMHNNSNNRLFVATAIVYYTGEAQAINHYTVDASAVETTEFKKNATFNWDGLKVYACYATDESDNVDITADCHVEADLSTEGAKKAKVYFGELEVGEYDITVIAGQENPALAYTPAELTIPAAEVGTWNAPEFSNTFNVSPISYSSNNTAVATVTEDGVIALAGGYGTAKITASFEETEDYIASVATYTITITEPVNKIDGEWHKVTSTSDIMAGSKVIVVGDKNGTKYAMGAQNTNNRAAVAAEEDANGVITANEGTKTFTLVDAGNGLYAFKANNGKYLYAASGSSNYLKEQAIIDGNASWLITIASNGEATIQAQGTYSNNLMRMNKNGNNNPLFSCYGSGQTAVMLYVNRKEYVAPAVDPENPTPATEVTINTNVDEEEIVASGNVIVTVDAKEFEEPKSYIAQNGATIIINNSGTSTSTEAKSVVVEDGSRIEAAAPTTTPTIYFATTMGSTQTPGTASELGSVTNITLAQGGEIIYDLTLGVDMSTPEGAAKAANQWHAFTLPFPVDAINGIYNAANGEKLTNEVDYAIMDYHGDVRANGLYGWKKYRGVLQPGVFYIMTVNGDVQTFRFKKAATGAMTQTTSMGYTAYNGSGTTTDYGWNGIGNPSWVSGTVTVNVQVLDPYTYTYQTLTAGVNITVSTPFFYNAGGDGSTGSVVMQDAGAGANYAPRRTPANEIKNVAISFGNEVFRDKLYISASEDALNEYEQDKDLVRMIMSNTPKVAQIFGNAYGMKLSMVNAPMANDKAEYSLTLYAPNAGEYTISAPEMENVDIYLTYNDAIIWNLSMGEYTNDFAKGNNEGYGLILKAKAPNAATGVDELEVSETAQKVIIDEHVFILRGEKMYDATGRMVK